MDCFCWARKEVGTAPFPKAKHYQKLKVGAYHPKEDSEIEKYMTNEEDPDISEAESTDEEQSEEVNYSENDELKEELTMQMDRIPHRIGYPRWRRIGAILMTQLVNMQHLAYRSKIKCFNIPMHDWKNYSLFYISCLMMTRRSKLLVSRGIRTQTLYNTTTITLINILLWICHCRKDSNDKMSSY